MRRIVPILASLMLGACNMVVSREPWFARPAEQGAPALRTGLWNFSADAGCTVDEAQPPESWPDCATPVLARDHRLVGIVRAGDPSQPEVPEEVDYILTAGDPRVLQLPGCVESGDGAAGGKLYCYLAVRAVASDRSGRIVRFRAWPVLCGPSAQGTAQATGRTYRGLRLTGKNCEARSVEALRAAARSSEAEANRDAPDAWLPHWVRDWD